MAGLGEKLSTVLTPKSACNCSDIFSSALPIINATLICFFPFPQPQTTQSSVCVCIPPVFLHGNKLGLTCSFESQDPEKHPYF